MSISVDSQPPSGGGQLGDVPYVRLPSPETLFAKRAARFAALATKHTLSEYLELLGRLAATQVTAAATLAAESLPWPDLGSPAARPLAAASHRRAEAWRDALRVILTELSTVEMPAESRAVVEELTRAPPERLEAVADRVLSNAVEGSDLAAGPFVAAAVQVYFTTLASRLALDRVVRAEDGCPVCGSLPVTGIVLGDDRLRYLVCSLCATQWHKTRLQCAACGNAKDLSYFGLDGGQAASVPARAASAAKAEACPSCKAYTKQFYVEQDPRLEPFADDVATLALDLLMAEEGWVRYGVNLFLVPAAGDRSA